MSRSPIATNFWFDIHHSDQNLPEHGQAWPHLFPGGCALTKNRPNLARRRPDLARFSYISTELGPGTTKIDQTSTASSDFSQIRATRAGATTMIQERSLSSAAHRITFACSPVSRSFRVCHPRSDICTPESSCADFPCKCHLCLRMHCRSSGACALHSNNRRGTFNSWLVTRHVTAAPLGVASWHLSACDPLQRKFG